jgi:DNA-directed RNA polymerase sigma subunit (sigma70/sigma32)
MFASDKAKVILDTIPVRSKEILSQIFGIGSNRKQRTMQDVAKEWNMTRQNVHSIKKKAFAKIRQYANMHFSQEELEALSEM